MSIQGIPAVLTDSVSAIGMGIGLIGVAIIVGGMILATYRALRPPLDAHGSRYVQFRREVGQAILLGLEFLVAADIIATVAVAPTMDNVLVLGGIVLIRTFLSLALEVELTGRWPWQSPADGKDVKNV